MFKQLHIKEQIGLVLLIIIHLGGVVGLHLELTSFFFIPLTPLTLLITTIVALMFAKEMKSKFVITCLSVAVLGWIVELIGVKTGVLFGAYEYTGTLGPGMFGIPFMIGINWLLLSYCVFCFLEFVPKINKWLKVLFGALAMAFIDVLIEPFAVQFDLWIWFTDSGMPAFQNYLAWFLVSIVVFVIYENGLKTQHNRVAASTFLILLFFFALNFMLF